MSSVASASSAPGPESRRKQAKLIAAASLGNTLEIFDFTVFSFFATIIGSQYFPSSTPYGSLLMAVGVFGVGFVMRPLGSMILGSYADRAGRKAAMLLTIVLMGLGTSIIALSPTYAQIGIIAPCLILVGRLLQGFSAGGEIGASTALLMESAGPGKRGFYISWQVSTQGLSSVIGSTCGALLTTFLPHDALYAWGWRLPFLIGLLIIPVGLYIRSNIDETFGTHQQHGKQEVVHNPVAEFIRNHLPQFILGLAIIMTATLLTYIMLFYMPTYMMNVSHLSSTLSYVMSIMVSLMLTLSGIASGLLIDRFKRRKPFVIGSLIIAILLVYPSFALIDSGSTLWLAFVLRLLIIAALGFNMTSGILLIIESLPRPVRATGLAMTYALGVAIFGGTAQFIVTWLLQITDNPLSPAWYLIIMLLIGLFACLAFRERHYD
ncbi:MFS transporter [Carnimonas nigrificans]|uniref:MFS transporter n=1 Tax=Carnimonas nigrificans TaxID=64323 RepID=UPI000471B0A8|nr:MFS transporter [Carnimonas nigrificans]